MACLEHMGRREREIRTKSLCTQRRQLGEKKKKKNEFLLYSTEQRIVIRTDLMKSRLNLLGKGKSRDFSFPPPRGQKNDKIRKRLPTWRH